MKNFTINTVILLALLFGITNLTNAQCSYDNTLNATWAAPATIGDSVYTNCIFGGEFIRLTGILAGESYRVSTCDGSGFTSQITIYPEGGGNYIDYNYYGCGSQAEILFIPTSSGNYDILIDEYYCEPDNSICMYLLVEKISCPQVDVNFNISPNPVCPNANVSFNAWGDVVSYIWNFGDGSPNINDDYINHSYTSVGTYPITLTLTNGCGNDTILYDTVHVVNNLPVPNAGFSISPNPVCPNDEVDFSSWGDANSFVWDFGDGSPNIDDNYTHHSYTSVGTYPITLTLTNGCGNDTVLYDTVYVNNNEPVLNTYYNISPNPVCPNTTVDFYATENASYIWSFGDGSPNSNDQYPNHSYTSAGNYPITLTLTNGCGNDTVLYDTVYVNNNLPVSYANFDISPNPVCPNTNVYFQAGGDVVSCIWNFGDGSPNSNNQYNNYSYSLAGNYPVWVMLTNGCGSDTILYDTVNVSNNLAIENADFEISPNPVCPGDEVYFHAWGDYGTYIWNFGDGDSSSNDSYIEHVYASAGNYPITITITNTCGNDTILYDTVYVENNVAIANADYDINPNTVCPDNEVRFHAWGDANSFVWDFGDGSPNIDDDYIYHSYSLAGTYPITLTLTNACGNDTVLYDTVSVADNLPVSNAGFIIYNNPTCPNDKAYFDAWGNANSFVWDFGDGSPNIDDDYTSHSYASTGTYPITVTITNGCGNDTILNGTVNIVSDLPISYANIYISHDTVCPGDMVFFNGGGGASSFVWDFGDGTPTSGNSSTNHIYTSVGTYPISLILTNGCGNDTILYDTVYVDNNVFPYPDFYDYWLVPDEACPGDTILFLVEPPGSSYLWNFGDGNTTTSTTEYVEDDYVIDVAKHAYSNTGSYTVILTLTNACGNSFTDSLYVDINNGVSVDGEFWWIEDNPIAGQNIEFFAIGGSSYEWDFGDGSAVVTTYASLVPLNHIYSAEGTYTINVTITNSCGDSETYSDDITIGSVGIAEDVLSDSNIFKIYPNPNNGSFSLEIESISEESLIVEIVNITGQIIYNKQYNNSASGVYKIDLSNQDKGLHSGIYIIKVTTNKGVAVGKVVLE